MKRLSTASLILLAACAPGLPGAGGGSRAVAPTAGSAWDPERLERDPLPTSAASVVDPAIVARRNALTLTDVVDVALLENPTTRISWSNARAASARLGAARGEYLPTADVDLLATLDPERSQSATGSFTWLLFSFDRGASIGAARHALVAADWTHNAAVQDVVLTVGTSYYRYAASRALLVAHQVTKAEADTNLHVAEERRRVGVATIAEVLQARTAAAQALLQLQRTEGEVLATRGALAVATGYPATAEFDIDTLAGTGPIGEIIDSVDALIALALRSRPDLAAAAATWQERRADARAAFGRRLPAITARGNVTQTYLSGQTVPMENSFVGIGLSIPIFNGFAWEYDALAAREVARAEEARAAQIGQRAVLEVFTDYYALRTATQSVRTTDELFASADESARAALGRYRAGVGSLLELLTAESALGDARAQRIEARLNWNIALLQLAHDVGALDNRGGHTLRIATDTVSTPAPR